MTSAVFPVKSLIALTPFGVDFIPSHFYGFIFNLLVYFNDICFGIDPEYVPLNCNAFLVRIRRLSELKDNLSMRIKTDDTSELDRQLTMTKALLHRRYWRTNVMVVSILLAIWFVVSFVFGILLSDELNSIRVFGFKLGFWWAHQGSIFIFVLLIFAYSVIMDRVDRRFGLMARQGGES